MSDSLKSRIHGCWLGKSIGGTLGLPAEGMMERLAFTYYDPVPTIAPPNDDLELQLVWLHLVEQSGASLTQNDFARAWLDHIHYMWDEYGRCRWNLRRGVPVEAVGTYENWFHAGMGSPIRSEIWACLFPGDPASAAWYAALDASLDHGIEGIAGEVFFTILQNLVLEGVEVTKAVGLARERLPDTELARAIAWICDLHAAGTETWAAWQSLLQLHGHENFTHAPLNVALTVWALLYGEGEFEKSILLAANGGYDTDCTCATVGATLGLALGFEAIPAHWSEPIGEGVFVGPGIRDITAPASLGELTQRTLALIGKLERKSWDDLSWSSSSGPELSSLPGTIYLHPLDGGAPVPWANGELPEAIKQSGGAEWDWDVAASEPKRIVALARAGAGLYLDGKLLLESPAGQPFVPAASRPQPGTVVELTPSTGKHRVRLELRSRDAAQEASLVLTYPNRHIAPWTAQEIPHRAIL